MNLLTAIYISKNLDDIKRVLKEEEEGKQPKSNYTDFLRDYFLITKEFNSDIAQLLVNAGANININVKMGAELNSLFDYCIASKKYFLVDFLLKNKVDTKELVIHNTCFEPKEFNEALALSFIPHVGVGINAYGKFSMTPLHYAVNLKDDKAIPFLCKNQANLNLPCKVTGATPLTTAIEQGQFNTATLLIQYKANIFSVPRSIHKKLQKTTSQEGRHFYQAFLAEMQKQLQQKEIIEKLELKSIKNIPLHLLKLDGKLIENIEARLLKESAISLSKPHMEKLKRALEASRNQPSQFQNMHLLNILSEISLFISNPEFIDQLDNTLCGPASFLTLLAKSAPDALIDLSLQLIQGKTIKPLALTLSTYSKEDAVDFTEILLTEIRRSSNYAGYAPDSCCEGLQGLTNPKLMCTWLEAFGYKNITDSTLVLNKQGSALSTAQNCLLSTLFCCFFHQDGYTAPPELKQLISDLNEDKQTILLLSSEFVASAEDLDCNFPEVSIHRGHETLYCGIPIDHYVYLNNIKQVNKDNVNLKFMTLGKIYNITVSTDAFLKGYRGTIIATAPNQPQPLLHQFINNNDDDVKEHKEGIEQMEIKLSEEGTQHLLNIKHKSSSSTAMGLL